MKHPFRVFLAALGATALLAAGVGVEITHLAASSPPAPRLRTVSPGTLSQAGITLAAASQPPYCDLEQGAVQRVQTGSGWAGCAISRQDAAAAALQGTRGTAKEAVLARVSGSGTVGRDRLAWLVVVQSQLLMMPATGCAPPVVSGPACATAAPGPLSTRGVVVVDGTTGQVLATVPVPSGS
jgi:hypothetical protein